MSTPTRKERLQLVAVMAAFAGVYLTHSLLRFRNFEAAGFDLGIFDQAVRQYAMFRAPVVPLLGIDFHLLGDHFHPVLMLLAPLYWVWADPRVLNLVQIALLVSTAIPVYLFARPTLEHRGALLTAAALLAWWPFQAAVNWDFHEVAFAVPLLAWIVWALEREHIALVLGLSFLLLPIREDLGVTAAAVGAVLMWRGWTGPGALLMATGLAGFVFLVKVVVPAFAVSGEFRHWQYSALGDGVGSAALFAVTHPFQTLGILVDHPKKQFLLGLTFVPLAGLPLGSAYAFIAAPILVSRLLNDRENVWAPVYQYDAVLAPVLLMAAVHALGRFADGQGWSRHKELAPMVLLALGIAGTASLPVLFPLHRTLSGAAFTPPQKVAAMERALAQIPDGVCAEVPDQAAPHLTGRVLVGLHGHIPDELTSWMVIDTTVVELGGLRGMAPDAALERASALGFQVLTEDDAGIWLLHREMPTPARCSAYVGLQTSTSTQGI